MSKKILIATTNKHKIEEFQKLFAESSLDVEVFQLKDFSNIKTVEETGQTFEDNAKLKALGYAQQTGLLTLAEDSGLSCDVLEGAPGVYSARFSGEKATDESNNQKLLKIFKPIPDNCRAAHYTAVIAIAKPGKVIGMAQGEVHGYIAKEPKGNNGFGYDPLFFYPPFDRTFGEVLPEMKNKVSHRSKAAAKAIEILKIWAVQDSNL